MNKHTADSMQFVGRVGNHSTKPSARGVNLLGWGVSEELSPEQQRKAMAARVTQISTLFREDKTMPKWKRAQLVTEQEGLVAKMREIRPTRRAPNVQQFFVDVARERLTKAEFSVWMHEAAQRMRVQEEQPQSEQVAA